MTGNNLLISERLEELLRREGITKADMARRIKAPLQTIYDWCDGTKRPNVDSLIKIADAYDVTLDWLVTGKEDPVKTDKVTDDAGFLSHIIAEICDYAVGNNLEPNDTLSAIAESIKALLEVSTFNGWRGKAG